MFENNQPEKDVDGFIPSMVVSTERKDPLFVPCAVQLHLLLEKMGVKLDGANAVVLGRSNIVGMPCLCWCGRIYRPFVIRHRDLPVWFRAITNSSC
jgi:5,10-methylene-tetrahydrofolate dehydrogenase/methenyl tetrahydrofolate cyclohydrolase